MGYIRSQFDGQRLRGWYRADANVRPVCTVLHTLRLPCLPLRACCPSASEGGSLRAKHSLRTRRCVRAKQLTSSALPNCDGRNFVLNGGNHLYGGADSTSPTTPEQVRGYTNFVVATLSHYAGQGILWELYNEPDLSVRHMTAAQYAALVTSVGKAVRANPAIASELLMGPSMSVMSCEYMKSMKALGALQYVDAVSVHAYVSGAPEQTRWQFDAIKKIVGPSMPVVSGEWGWATCTGPSGAPVNCIGGTQPDVVSEADQAMYVARQWLVNALERIPLSVCPPSPHRLGK